MVGELDPADLPELTREMIETVGFEDTLRIAAVYGGQRITFTEEDCAVGSPRDILALILGTKAASFFKRFYGRAVYISRRVVLRVRDEQIRAEAKVFTVRELAEKYDTSERRIRQVLKDGGVKW